MLKKFLYAASILLIIVTISMTFTFDSKAQYTAGCGQDLPKLTLDTSAENNFDFGKKDEVVLLEGTCSQLKSGACGTGTCEHGWKCMDTGIQCLCSPPE